MSLLLVSAVTILGVLLGKILFSKWFNHLSLYSAVFGGAIFLYELRLLPYVELTPFTWFVMSSAFISFLLGILSIISARSLFRENPTFIIKKNLSLKLFSDGGRALKYFIIVFSIISFYSAYELWIMLIHKFGSIPGVIINAKVIYRLNIDGKLIGTTPYIFLFGYVAVFFSAIYTAYKGKFTILTFIPILSIILREVAQAGRAGMLVALMEFTCTFFLFRHLLKNDLSSRYKFSKKNALFASILFLSLFIAASTIVRLSRSNPASENFTGASRELKETKGNLLISPTVYLYFSSDVGVLSKYLSSKGENTPVGQNTFMTLYLYMSKFGIVEKPHEFQRGYNIPMWTNTGTYLRELHADFGISGIFVGPFLLGLLITWLWFNFYENHNLILFAIFVYLNIIVGFSFFVMASRILYWTFGLGMNLFFIPIIEKFASFSRQD